MGWRFSIEIIAVLIMAGGLGGIFYGILKGAIAFSPRTLQFLAITFILPMIMVLSMEGRLGSDAASAIIGTIVGYVLAGLSRNEAA